MKAVARLLAALMGALIALACSQVASAAVGVPDAPASIATYVYDAHCPSAQFADTALERGPPAAQALRPTYAVGLGSRGASACSDGPTPRAVITYDDPAPLVQGAQPTGTTREQAKVADVVSALLDPAGVAANGGAPLIKAGSHGGETAGKRFPQSVKDEVLEDNPNVCVYCRMETDRPQVDHAIPRSRGGNATVENGQTACPWCNNSKNNRD